MFSLFFVLICVFSMSGYDIKITKKTDIYQSVENVSVDEMVKITTLDEGVLVNVLGCFDSKTDMYFYVRDQKNYGYIYDFNFHAIKNWTLSLDKVKYFFKEPLANIQCLIMVSRFSN